MSDIIVARGVSKSFRQPRRFAGLSGAVKGLFTREFTEVRAVENISFVIGEGEAVGYLGPNGAGRSTMIKMMIDRRQPLALLHSPLSWRRWVNVVCQIRRDVRFGFSMAPPDPQVLTAKAVGEEAFPSILVGTLTRRAGERRDSLPASQLKTWRR